MPGFLSIEQARAFYDRFGARQDRQGFYEDGALDLLVQRSDPGGARSVLEIGCGTGRLAARLLDRELPADARYIGIDISETMVGLARTRLAPFGGRARVLPGDGSFEFSGLDGPFDRILTSYVLDLLSPEALAACLSGARRVIAPEGLFCHAGLTPGPGLVSGAMSALWSLVHRLSPGLVGGCRPLALADHLPTEGWRVVSRDVSINAAIASEIVILAPQT